MCARCDVSVSSTVNVNVNVCVLDKSMASGEGLARRHRRMLLDVKILEWYCALSV